MSDNKMFLSFTPGVSKKSIKAMNGKIRKYRLRKRTEINLKYIAEKFNPIIRGWINYYGKFNRSRLYPLFRYFNQTLIGWIRKKFKTMRSLTRAGCFIDHLAKRQPNLFVHWKVGMIR